MNDLFWTGDQRADGLMDNAAFIDAMVTVEQAWLDTLVDAGMAPAGVVLTGLVTADDHRHVAHTADAGGNPAQPVVDLLRQRSGCAWVHRALTSQDVIDTAMALCLKEAGSALQTQIRAHTVALTRLVDEHRHTLMAARTLGRHAVPTTFGRKAAGWLQGMLDAADRLPSLCIPAQLGGAAGTLSAVVELTGTVDDAVAAVRATARRLGLGLTTPWHTTRAPITAAGDALVACTEALGRIAADVLTLSRSEIGEVSQASPGPSSTMPHKQNPVLAVLIRRAALTAPALGAMLHTAAAMAVDERSDGAWHAEWSALRDLTRRSVIAASQMTDLLAGLNVDVARMERTARAAWDELTAERSAVAAFTGRSASPGDYLGALDAHIDLTLTRAKSLLGAT